MKQRDDTTTQEQQLSERFEQALTELENAPAFAKARYQTPVFRLATDLLDQEQGAALLFEFAHRFDSAGVFHGGPWEDPSKLLPELVGVGLKGEGVYPSIEALSDLRMLAVAEERATSEKLDAARARAFLGEACAKNLQFLFPQATEERRQRLHVFRRAERLFRLIADHISLDGLRKQVIEEIELICAQRPIVTGPVKRLLAMAEKLPAGDEDGELAERLRFYERAVGKTSARADRAGNLIAYRKSLLDADADSLTPEIEAFAASLQQTGLASPYHAVLLRRLQKIAPERIGDALALDETGAAELRRSEKFIGDLVRVAILPATAESIYGLKAVLERGLLGRSEVSAGLRKIIDLPICSDVREKLLALLPADAGLAPNSILLAACLSVLGQPLGVSQGNNPTCQAARGISLWSQHAPGLLLGMIATAVRDNVVECKFEGQLLRSSDIKLDVAYDTTSLEVDAVSVVLVPHLDKLYFYMQQLVSLRGEDPHRWVNPALYGRWVPNQFVAAIDSLSGAVRGHNDFVRRFCATHHPEYNDGYQLVYPNPVGIMVTDVHGNLLGPHAVSIQRIAADPGGELRIYFFNPNHEGRQDWGQGVTPSVAGCGERPGESSLPFAHFTSRMYAFHFDPYEEGDAYAVPSELVESIGAMAKETWGRAYPWID